MVFPTKGTMYCAPVCDREMYAEQTQRAGFWHRPDGLFGMDVSAMQAVAERSHFASAISDIVSAPMLPCGVGCAGRYTVDFTTATPVRCLFFALVATQQQQRRSLLRTGGFRQHSCRGQRYTSGVACRARRRDRTHVHRPPPPAANPCWTSGPHPSRFGLQAVHGLAAWFDVEFLGSTDQRTLSTAPDVRHLPTLPARQACRTFGVCVQCPRTHWYQTILPLREPLLVEAGASLSATLTMTKNRRRSYDIEIGLCAESVDESGERATQSQRNVVFLQDMLCRYLWSGRAGGHA